MEHTFAVQRGVRGRFILAAAGLLALIPLASMALQPRSAAVGESVNLLEPLMPVCFDGETLEVPGPYVQQALSNGGELGECDVPQQETASVSSVETEVKGFDDEDDDRDEDALSSEAEETPSWALPRFMRSVGSSVSSVSSAFFSSFSSLSSSSSSSSDAPAQVLGTQEAEDTDEDDDDDGGTHIQTRMNVHISTDGNGQTVETRQVWENGELKVNESNVSGGVSSMYYDDEIDEDGEDRDEDDEDMPEWMEDMFDD